MQRSPARPVSPAAAGRNRCVRVTAQVQTLTCSWLCSGQLKGNATNSKSKPIPVLKTLWLAKGTFKDCSSAPVTPDPRPGTGLGSQAQERLPAFKKQNFLLEGAKGNSPVLSRQIQSRTSSVLQNL